MLYLSPIESSTNEETGDLYQGDLIQATENRVADVLHIDKVVLEEQKPQHCYQDSSDLQSLMELLKQKPDISTDHREKSYTSDPGAKYLDN